jgi:sugar lactone lactonase YvrE
MRYLILFLLLLTTSPALAQANPPDQLRVQGANRNPEGLECDLTNERFLLSSLSEGTVYAIDYTGTATPFIEDDDLISSVGLEVDAANHRLLVVNASMQSPDHAELGIYDLTTRERLHMVDLASLAPDARHFPNDLALDPDGIAYVTDSLAPVIYRVDPEGNATVILRDDRLLIDDFGGNGIVYHPDGYLLVGISGVELYKIPLDDPAAFTIVKTPITVAADGMLWDSADNNLIVVSDGNVLRLSSADDWASATVTATARRHPASTAAFCGESVYVIHPQANNIVRVEFTASK